MEYAWWPARVTSLPFHQNLPINSKFNQICLQVLVWTSVWETWTIRIEPYSNRIRRWDQISVAQALAALPPKMQHLADNLIKGVAFALKYKAQVDRDQRRGRTELRAGMEVGFQAPGQRSKREVSR